MTPAIIGIGFLHVLAGMVVWILLPLLSGESKPEAQKNEALVWRKPDDFIESKLVKPTVADEVADTKPVSFAPHSPSPHAEPVKLADAALTNSTANLQITPASNMKTSFAKSPFEILTAHNPTPPAAFQHDTLAKLERSVGTDAQDLLGASAAMTIQSSPVAGSSVPSIAPATVSEAPPQLNPASGREANKYITLSAIHDSPKPAKATLSLLDIAKLNEAEREQQKALRSSGLDAVEHALQQTLLRAWVPPSIDLVPANQRRVSVELAVFRDGSVKEAVLKTPSGSDALDDSVRAALARVTKIPETLPASFTKERYAVRVNLQIE